MTGDSIMKQIGRLILAMMILSMSVSLFACKKPDFADIATDRIPDETIGDTADETSSAEQTDDAQTSDELVIVNEGKTDFRIVRAENASPMCQKASIELTRHFTNAGIKIQITTDWDTKRHDPNSYEILVGDTAYTPDGAIQFDPAALGTKGYVIEVIENKILLRAGDDSALSEAVTYFTEHFLKTQDATMSIPTNYRLIQSNGIFLSQFCLAGQDISDYAIVCENANFQENAKLLAQLIQDKCGVTLPQTGKRRILLTSSGAIGSTVSADFENGDLVVRAANAAEMKKAILCFWMEEVYHETGTLNLPAELSYSRDLTKTVFYSDYITPQDNVCCLDGLIAAHNAANAGGYKVFADLYAHYYISSTGKTTTIKTDVDWGNASFTIDDSKVSPDGRGNWIFKVASDLKSYALTGITSLDRDQTNLGITLPKKSLITFYDNNTMQYIRSGGNANDGSAKRDTVVVNTDGSIDPSAPLIWDFDRITSATVLPIDDAPLYVSGGSFTTIANQAPSEYTYYARGINITRSNTNIQNVRHYVIGEGKTGAPYSAFFQVSNCAYVTVENCLLTGHKTYQSPTTKMGSYDINGNGAISLTFRNCMQTNDITNDTYWGVLGSNFCKNLVYDGCILSRFDAHQGVANATIINSIIGHAGANAIGFGTLRIENSNFYSSCIVNLRNDYGSTWEGDVIIRNCYYKPTKDTNCYLINGKNDGKHDFGYLCHMPRTVTIDGLYVDSAAQMYVYANLNPNYTSESYVADYPHVVTESVTVTGFTCAGNKTLQLSPNQVQFRTTQFTVK